MTLAASGEMSLAGTVTDRSIQVELGGNGSTQMSMNDEAVRALGGKETAGSEINMSTDFYNASAVPGITARYWRFTKFVPNTSGSFLTRMELYTGFSGSAPKVDHYRLARLLHHPEPRKQLLYSNLWQPVD